MREWQPPSLFCLASALPRDRDALLRTVLAGKINLNFVTRFPRRSKGSQYIAMISLAVKHSAAQGGREFWLVEPYCDIREPS